MNRNNFVSHPLTFNKDVAKTLNSFQHVGQPYIATSKQLRNMFNAP